MPYQMYKYFESNTITVLNELMASVKQVDEPTPGGAKIPQVRKTRLDKNHR